jgi:hypothetical protein
VAPYGGVGWNGQLRLGVHGKVVGEQEDFVVVSVAAPVEFDFSVKRVAVHSMLQERINTFSLCSCIFALP